MTKQSFFLRGTELCFYKWNFLLQFTKTEFLVIYKTDDLLLIMSLIQRKVMVSN